MEEEVIIVKNKNELYDYLLKSSMKRKNNGEKTVADRYFIE